MLFVLLANQRVRVVMLKKVIKNQSSDLVGMCKSTTFAPAFRESGSAMIDMMNEASVLPKKNFHKNLEVIG